MAGPQLACLLRFCESTPSLASGISGVGRGSTRDVVSCAAERHALTVLTLAPHEHGAARKRARLAGIDHAN
jgi:hypothetical protein